MNSHAFEARAAAMISAAVASGLRKRSALSRRSEASGWRLAFDVLISANSLAVPRPFAARWCLLFDHLGDCTVATISLKVGSNSPRREPGAARATYQMAGVPGRGKVFFLWRGSECLPDAEEQATDRFAGAAVELETIVQTEQEPRRADAQTKACRSADIAQ